MVNVVLVLAITSIQQSLVATIHCVDPDTPSWALEEGEETQKKKRSDLAKATP